MSCRALTKPTLVALIAGLALLLALETHASTIIARTTLAIDPVTVDGDLIDSLVMDWSTEKTSGVVLADDLTSLTFTLFSGDAVIFEDPAIVNGQVQPIAGVNRSVIDFGYDLETLVLSGVWDNDSNVVQQAGSLGTPTIGASGTTWNLFLLSANNPNIASFDKFSDGGVVSRANINIVSQTTLIIPEPSSLAVFGIVGLVMMRRRR